MAELEEAGVRREDLLCSARWALTAPIPPAACNARSAGRRVGNYYDASSMLLMTMIFVRGETRFGHRCA